MQTITVLLSLAAAVNAYTEIGVVGFMFKNIDPVVIPGKYKSHMHTFFGSDAITLNTTTSAELQKGCTTAENPNDLSVYWVPTLYYTGKTPRVPIYPYRFSAYYEGIPDAEIPIPQNYKAVVGNSKAKTQADVNPLSGITWYCEGDPPENKDVAAFPQKTCSTHMQHLILFHDCVNPDDLTQHTYSGVQNWNATYKQHNRCPEHMKRIPRLRLSIRYDVRGLIPQGWNGPPPLELASGPSYSAHADVMNGWLPEAAQNMLLAGKTDFHVVTGPISGGRPNCKPQDKDPKGGTSDWATSVAMMNAAKRDAGYTGMEFRA